MVALRTIFFATIFLVSTLSLVDAASSARLDAFHPTWGHPSGGDVVTVVGCRFRNYGAAACQFGEWTAPWTKIVDDKTILCVTPNVLNMMEKPTWSTQVPVWGQLSVNFEGNANVFETKFNSTNENFYFGPMITSISPTLSSVNGGGTLTISGWGFMDVTMGTAATVWFDGTSVATTVTSDTTLSVTIPPGDFNREVRVDVKWADHYSYHSTHTVSYGPYVTAMPCSVWANGTNTLTFTGGNFGDLGTPYVNFSRSAGADTLNVRVAAAVTGGGSGLTVVAPVLENVMDSFAATVYMVVLGSNNDEIAYWFASGAGSSGEMSKQMGPGVVDISPTQGHLGGGDLFTVNGCGFDAFRNDQTQVRFGSIVACFNDTLVSKSDTAIVCKTPSAADNGNINCASATAAFDVQFDYFGFKTRSPSGTATTWTYGPQFSTATTITRGKVFGGDSLVVTGSFMEFTAGTPFSRYQCDFASNPTAETNATLSGSNTLTCLSPPWDISGPTYIHTEAVNWRFGTSGDTNSATNCFLSPGSHTFRWFPVCDRIEPTYGWLEGGREFTVHGAGFSDDAFPGDTKIHFDTSGINTWEQAATDVQSFADRLTGKTPIMRYADRGGNRLWRAVGTVVVYFNSTDQNNTKSLQCSPAASYLFGPTLTAITPEKGPIGPKGSTLPQVTAVGLAVDEWAGKENLVRFGNILGTLGTTTGNNVQTNPNWASPYYAGERVSDKTLSNTEQDVEVFFNAENRTTSGIDFMWGPWISNISNQWGYHPNNTMAITITGGNFNEFDGTPAQIQCVVEATVTQATVVSDTEITCPSPLEAFGTTGKVWVIFGTNCVSNSDASRALLAGNIYYKPRITSINPTFGWTSGNRDLTIHGEGFQSYDDNTIVWVGDYESTKTTTFGSADSVTVKTPNQGPSGKQDGRGDFGSDVPVAFALDGIHNWRVWYSGKYHYGPICSQLDAGGRLNSVTAGETFTVRGGGFDDHFTFREDRTWVSFGNVNGTANSNTGGTWTTKTPPNNCAANPAIVLHFELNDGTFETISCGNQAYGPTITAATATCSGSQIAWREKTVSLTGTLMNDADYYTGTPSGVTINVGSASSPATAVTASSIDFDAPANAYSTTPQAISVTWNSTFCSGIVGSGVSLVYSPSWTSISVTNGVVQGGTTVIVQGDGFSCFDFTHESLTFGAAGLVNSTVATDNTLNFLSQNHSSHGNAGVGSEPLTLSFNGTGLPTLSGFNFWYGPYVTAITPTQGTLKGDETVTLTGLNMNDPFWKGSAAIDCQFVQNAGGATTFTQAEETTTANTVTCKTPTYRNWGDGYMVSVRWNHTDADGRGVYDSASATPSQAYSFVNRPIIVSVAPTFSKTSGGDSIVVTGRDWSDWSSARCMWANRILAADVGITSSTITCVTPRAPFGYSGKAGVIFEPDTHMLSGAWHWHPYVTTASSTSIPIAGEASWIARGAGFCGYQHVKVNLGASGEAVQSDIRDNWHSIVQAGLVSDGAVTAIATFCDETEDCDCFYKGTPDAVPFSGQITFA